MKYYFFMFITSILFFVQQNYAMQQNDPFDQVLDDLQVSNTYIAAGAMLAFCSLLQVSEYNECFQHKDMAYCFDKRVACLSFCVLAGSICGLKAIHYASRGFFGLTAVISRYYNQNG